MGRRKTLAIAILACAAAGCGQRPEPVAELPSPYPVTVRGAAAEVTVLPQPPRRIVALDPSSAELLAALAAEARLVAVPAGLSEPLAASRPVVVSRSGQVDVDAVVRARPDLIVSTPGTDPADARKAADTSGAALYVHPSASVDDVERAAIELGFLVGVPVQARRLAGSLEREIARVEIAVAGRLRVRVFVDTGFLITVPTRSLVGDLIHRAGGVSVAGPTPRSGPYDVCEVARLEPDVFLRLTERGEPPHARPRFARCTVRPREMTFAELTAELVARPGPRVAEALAAMARTLHPDAFR